MTTAPVEIKEGYADAAGYRIHYLEAGDGFPLILLNGRDALMSGEQWRLNMPALAEVAHVYALDVLGYGKSDLPTEGYTFDTFVDMVEGFMDSLGIQQADIVLVVQWYGGQAHPGPIERYCTRLRHIPKVELMYEVGYYHLSGSF